MAISQELLKAEKDATLGYEKYQKGETVFVESGSKTVNGYDTKVNVGQQNKHIPGSNEYKKALNNGQTKSIMYGDANDIQNLLNDKASKTEKDVVHIYKIGKDGKKLLKYKGTIQAIGKGGNRLKNSEKVLKKATEKGYHVVRNAPKVKKATKGTKKATALEKGLKGVRGSKVKNSKKVAKKHKSGLDSIIKNGKVSIDDLKANPSLFSGKSVDEIAQALTDAGYDVTVKASTRSRSGAQIIKINNPGGGKNISQVQVSPGGGRHGSSPYVKISTTDQGIIKIIDGSESLYKTDGKETATIIFSGGN